MNRVTIFGVIFAILFVVKANAQDEDKMAAVEAMISLSGLDHMAENLEDSLRNTPAQTGHDTGDRKVRFENAHELALAEAFDGKFVLDAIRTRLMESVSMPEMEHFTKFYQSEFGERVLELENAAQTSEFIGAVINETESILAKRAENEDRFEIVAEVIAALRSKERFAALYSGMSYAALKGMSESGALENPVTDEEITVMIENTFPARWEQHKRLLTASIYAAYSPLDLEEFAQYRDFLSDDTTQRIHFEIALATDLAISGRAKTYGHVLAKALAERKS